MEAEKISTTPKEVIAHEIAKDRLLIPAAGVSWQLLDADHLEQVAAHYRKAFLRGDFFAGRYSDPEKEIFDPDWLSREIDNKDKIWVIFTRNGQFVGSTGLFYEDNAIRSDETQIDFAGRGLQIMTHFFRRVIPKIEALGMDIVAEFVLTPESKGLRRTLQAELGMKALGIHPHILVHRLDGHTTSEISAANYHNLKPQKVIIVPALYQLYQIVAEQFSLGNPEVVSKDPRRRYSQEFTQRYQEVKVTAWDWQSQEDALADGYSPVKYDPRDNTFPMAKFPDEKPDLSFIIGEGLVSNIRLVDYLNTRLYQQEQEAT